MGSYGINIPTLPGLVDHRPLPALHAARWPWNIKNHWEFPVEASFMANIYDPTSKTKKKDQDLFSKTSDACWSYVLELSLVTKLAFRMKLTMYSSVDSMMVDV